MQKKNIAQRHVFQKIKAIRHIGKESVYNMEVKKFHNFIVNDAFISHNCIDALRYSLDEYIRKKGIDYSGLLAEFNTIR